MAPNKLHIGDTVSRWDLPEIEDQPWCPAIVREFAMDHLRALSSSIAPYRRCAPIVFEMLERSRTYEVLDLCSGSGGPWPSLLADMRSRGSSVSVTLSDRYPPSDVSTHSRDGIRYHAGPIDATDLPPGIPGAITIFTAFHHFSPPHAKKILSSAVAQKRPIAIFEATEKSWTGFFQVLVGALLIFVSTPFIKPLKISRLTLTYILPVVPFLVLFDGVMSVLRSYSPADLRTLAKGLGDGSYVWREGRIPPSLTKPAITYLIGSPAQNRHRSQPSCQARPHQVESPLEAARQVPR